MRVDREDGHTPEYHKIPPEYPQISPSSLKLLDDEHPEQVTRDQMHGAVRDYAASQIDLYFQQSVRDARGLQKDESEEVLYHMGDSARKWFDQFRGEHEFFKNGKEGDQHSAQDVRSYWESGNLTNFVDDLVVAHERIIGELRRADEMGEKVISPLLLETDPSLDVYPKQNFVHNAYLGNQIKFQLSLRRDYLLHDPSNEDVIVIHTTFGAQKEVDTLDVFLHTLFANEDVKMAHSQHVQTRPISARTRLDNILYYYRFFDWNRKQFIYRIAPVANIHSLETWSGFLEKLATVRDQYYELRRIQRMRGRSFVMPQHNPNMRPSVEDLTAENQPRLFHF